MDDSPSRNLRTRLGRPAASSTSTSTSVKATMKSPPLPGRSTYSFPSSSVYSDNNVNNVFSTDDSEFLDRIGDGPTVRRRALVERSPIQSTVSAGYPSNSNNINGISQKQPYLHPNLQNHPQNPPQKQQRQPESKASTRKTREFSPAKLTTGSPLGTSEQILSPFLSLSSPILPSISRPVSGVLSNNNGIHAGSNDFAFNSDSDNPGDESLLINADDDLNMSETSLLNGDITNESPPTFNFAFMDSFVASAVKSSKKLSAAISTMASPSKPSALASSADWLKSPLSHKSTTLVPTSSTPVNAAQETIKHRLRSSVHPSPTLRSASGDESTTEFRISYEKKRPKSRVKRVLRSYSWWDLYDLVVTTVTSHILLVTEVIRISLNFIFQTFISTLRWVLTEGYRKKIVWLILLVLFGALGVSEWRDFQHIQQSPSSSSNNPSSSSSDSNSSPNIEYTDRSSLSVSWPRTIWRWATRPAVLYEHWIESDKEWMGILASESSFSAEKSNPASMTSPHDAEEWRELVNRVKQLESVVKRQQNNAGVSETETKRLFDERVKSFVDDYEQKLKRMNDNIAHLRGASREQVASVGSSISREEIIALIQQNLQTESSTNISGIKNAEMTMTLDDLKPLMAELLAVHEPDYALESAGARILLSLTSPTYDPAAALAGKSLSWLKWVGLGVKSARRGVSEVLKTGRVFGKSPGECWGMEGSDGYIAIQLARPVKITEFIIEHAPLPSEKTDSSAKVLSSAPKNIEFYALTDPQDFSYPSSLNTPTARLLAYGTYDISKSGWRAHSQKFSVIPNIIGGDETVKYVLLRVASNWGNDAYTCVYHVGIHGSEV